MFSELVESVVARKQTRKRWAIVASGTVQCACLVTLLLTPLIYTRALPKSVLNAMLTVPAPSLTPARPAPAVPRKATRLMNVLYGDGRMHQPTRIPSQITIEQDETAPPDLPPSQEGNNGFSAQDPLDSLTSPGNVARPEPPTPAVTQRIKQGGDVEAAKIISQSRPEYPVLAREAGIQGNVVLHAIIDKNGRVSELQVVTGHPLLVKAALDAVRAWRYQPTLLNGEPVEVDTTVTVSFVLAR